MEWWARFPSQRTSEDDGMCFGEGLECHQSDLMHLIGPLPVCLLVFPGTMAM